MTEINHTLLQNCLFADSPPSCCLKLVMLKKKKMLNKAIYQCQSRHKIT